jgi:site-specific DNA-adenine methylase
VSLAVGTPTSSSPADAALRRAEAFLRVVNVASDAAGEPRSSARAARTADGELGAGDERQMLLPHVRMDAPGAAPAAVTPEAPAIAAPDVVVEKTIWGSPAGKKHLAPRLVKLIPPHKTYVEPFAGSGAVFFEKPPSDKEILADADPEIAFAYKALSTLTDGELAALKKKDWTGRRTLYRAMQEATPRSKVEKLYRFLYLSHFAYGKLRGKSYNPNAEGIEARTIDRIEKFRDRLRGVTVRSGHYADVVKEFDGKDTFFFLDPPYPGHNVEVGEDRFDEVEFRKILDGIKGKFLVTYGTRGELDTTGFHVRKIRTRRSIASMRGVGGPKTLPQLLIANYAITQKSLGPYELDEVEAAVELTGGAAADLDLARVLAKALAHEADVPVIRALARELDRFDDDASAERAAALARALLPLGDRLVPAIEASIPDLASALQDARPALDDLVKAHGGLTLAKAQPPQCAGATRSEATPGTADLAPAALGVVLGKRIPLLKTGEEHYVLGIVLEPETVDAQNDIYSAAEVREAAHRFMQEYQNVGLMHRDLVNGKVKILESYLTPAAFEISGAQIRKGTWLLAVRIVDDALWAQVKNGELTGLSIGGSAVRSAASA